MRQHAIKCRWLRTASIVAVSVLLHAATATAENKHRLLAQTSPLGGELTLDPNVSSVEDHFEDGVAGTDPNSRSLAALVDSASGVLVVNGTTNALMLPNRSRAVGLLEQLMVMDSVPTVIDTILVLDGGGGGGFIELDARLKVGNCSVGLARDVGIAIPTSMVTTSGCSDNSFVTWEAGGDSGAIHVRSTWSKLPPLGEVYLETQVSGDFGGTSSDIPTGSFAHSGAVSIGTSGGNVVFHSDSFLTVPEPGAAAEIGAALGSVALLSNRRARR